MKGSFTIGQPTSISNVFDLQLINHSNDPIEIPAPISYGTTRLFFNGIGGHPSRPPPSGKKESILLKPGQSASLLGNQFFSHPVDSIWTMAPQAEVGDWSSGSGVWLIHSVSLCPA